MAEEIIRIATAELSAEINPLGAELWALADGEGRPLMWNGDPAWWSGRAPLLFPVVGGLVDGRYRLDGETFELPRHGFARRKMFKVVEHGPALAVFRLVDDAETRAVYPFAFSLTVRFEVSGARLIQTVEIANSGEQPMPASLGFHPAFLWPLPYGDAREAHRIVFDKDEPAPVRGLGSDSQIAREPFPTPVEGRVLRLHDGLFEHDTVVFDVLESRSLRYGAEGGPQLEISFEGLPHLGVWTKPGAPYICIEPWCGFADESGFAGELREKPGVFDVTPGSTKTFAMSIALIGA